MVSCPKSGVDTMINKSTLSAHEAAELIKGRGGGEVTVFVHDNGLVTVTAISGGDVSRAQQNAEAILHDVQKSYQIVKKR